MPKKKKSRVVRGVPPSTAPQEVRHKPQIETVVVHTTRERKRNASGGALSDKAGSTIIPVLGGLAGGSAAVIAMQKWNTHPGLVAAGAAAAGLAAMSLGKQPWLRQAGAGAVVGAAVVGVVPHIVGAFHKTAPQQAQAKPQPSTVHRMAEGDGFVTRGELNDALSKLADTHKETQKQQNCDLLTALRDEIRTIVAEGPNGPGLPERGHPPALQSKQGASAPQFTYPFTPRSADADEYTRNAYGEDIRDAEADEYTRNAYGDDIRDAEADEYTRNAYGDDLRDASVYDERDASVYDERDASANDERDASVYDERDANGDQHAQMTGGSSM